MADTGGELNPPKKIDAREKLRAVRERQAEERQRRLEELKKHALEAQQLREQKEIERRKRMDDLRQKENEKRCQVEERKRQIWEAERERREAIVRKNQEREARIETKKKNEKSSIVFAFGSSTPRLLETTDSSNSFWGPRRATSTANLRLYSTATATPQVSLSRRPSERELEPKKRASSAGGLYRNPGDIMTTSMYEVFHWDTEPQKPRLSLFPNNDPLLSNVDDPSTDLCDSQNPNQIKNYHISHAVEGDIEGSSVMSSSQYRIGRRKTDLMPTIPSPREGTTSRPTSGSRSLARTPGDTTPSRPGSVLSQCSLTSASTPTPAPRMRSAPRKPRPFSIHITGVSKDKDTQKINSPSEEKSKQKENKVTKPPAVRQMTVKKQIQQKNEEVNNKVESVVSDNSNPETVNDKINGDASAEEKKSQSELIEINKEVEGNNVAEGVLIELNEGTVNNQNPSEKLPQNPEATVESPNVNSIPAKIEQNEKKEVSSVNEMENSVSMDEEFGKTNVMTRSKITTEEEAKAALAERRRLAREQAEREAEAERVRLEMEAKMEAERLRKEEEEQRLAEEEQLRLLEEARKIEEDRLMQAIQEAKKREEEERERRQQEEIARLEKEEAERKAREEAERQRVEMVERLKREEEERQARRKRVEAIMKRTRNNPANSTNKADSEKGEEDGAEHEKDEPKNKVEDFLHGERISTDRTLTNGQNSQESNRKGMLDNNLIDQNNHSNGVEITTSSLEKEDCLNSNSNSTTLVTPLIEFQGKTKDASPVAANYMA